MPEDEPTGLCAALLAHVLIVSGQHDWSRLLGMVNVASIRRWEGSFAFSTFSSTHRAFVVGINSYSSLDLTPMRKCVNDANDMGDLLGRKGYDVVLLTDATRSQFVTAFDSFCDGLAGAQSVVIYFSGHGAAPANESFLTATDSTRKI